MIKHRYRITIDLDTSLNLSVREGKKITKEIIKNSIPSAKNIKVDKIK